VRYTHTNKKHRIKTNLKESETLEPWKVSRWKQNVRASAAETRRQPHWAKNRWTHKGERGWRAKRRRLAVRSEWRGPFVLAALTISSSTSLFFPIKDVEQRDFPSGIEKLQFVRDFPKHNFLVSDKRLTRLHSIFSKTFIS